MMRRMFLPFPTARRCAPGLLLLLVAAAACSAGPAPPEPAPNFEWSRWLGRWYVVAALPRVEDVANYIEYRRREDGRIDAVSVTRDGDASQTRAQIVEPDPRHPARWDVARGWLFSEDWRVLYVSADYRHAIVGDAGRETLWLLAREPSVTEWIYAGLVARVALGGYDVSRLERVRQETAP